jgi:predicted nucleic acid-binding protein
VAGYLGLAIRAYPMICGLEGDNLEDSKAVRANLLDASALVKLFVKEDGSDILNKYLRKEAIQYTTPICFYETLNVLKVKWLYRKEITQQKYLSASFGILAWFSASSYSVKDVDFLSPDTFRNVQAIMNRYGLDISDAFQIVSVKDGYFSRLVADSRTVLVTADEALATAARKENLLSWYILKDPPP